MENFDNNDAPESQAHEQTAETQPEDRIKNMQSEYSRKIENLNAQVAEQNRRLEEILASVSQPRQSQPAAPQKPLKDLVFDDPEAYARMVEEQAVRRASDHVEKKIQLSQATTNVVAEIQSKYSEFSEPNSQAAQMALQRASRQPDYLRGTPEGARLAMMEVVAEMGLVPVSKRSAANQRDDFALGGQSTPRSQRRSDPAKEVDPATLAFAQELGIDISDPKRIEGLKQASQRKEWNRYR